MCIRDREKAERVYTRSILNMKVTTEPLWKTSELIMQCKRCQDYNHTQRYCSQEVRCVKCLGKHLTRECSIKQDQLPTCVKCREHYPANYRGREVAKQLQRIKNQRQIKEPRQRTISQGMKLEKAPVKSPPPPLEQKQSYTMRVKKQYQQETAEKKNYLYNYI